MACEPIELSQHALELLGAHLQLIFTGQVRLAKNLLRDVLRRWLLGRPASVSNIGELIATARAMASALHAADIAAVGAHLDDYWAQKRRMCDAEPVEVARMLQSLRSKGLIYGGSLAGAGGGGFLLVITRRPHARDELAEALAGTSAEIYEAAIDCDGLVLSIELPDAEDQTVNNKEC